MLVATRQDGFNGFGLAGGGISPLGTIKSLIPAAWFRYGVGITVTGSGVSTWADQSGNGRDLLQGTDTNRPALQADNSILFDGADNFLKCTNFTLNQPLTVYLLFRQVSWTINDVIFDGGTAAVQLFQDTTTPNISLFAGSAAASNTGLATNTYAVVTSVFNGASSLLQVNEGAATTGNPGANNAGGFTLGANRSGAGNFSNIQVKEVILFAAAHDAATRARVIRYLMKVGQI